MVVMFRIKSHKPWVCCQKDCTEFADYQCVYQVGGIDVSIGLCEKHAREFSGAEFKEEFTDGQR